MEECDKKYILYGAGCVGMKALEYYGLEAVDYFVDANCYGTTYCGIPIISPNELLNVISNQKLIICSSSPKSIQDISVFLREKSLPFSVFNSSNELGEYVFVDRKKERKKLLIVLAGYKDYLWDQVFCRIKKFVDGNTDVCILSAGKYCKQLDDIAYRNAWSYLSTEENRVGMIQNLAIKLHPSADLIFKMDEDIFLTKNTLSEMEHLYHKLFDERKYAVGFVAPLINVNGYGYRRILEITESVTDYSNRFGTPTYGHGKIFSDVDVCKYMWELTTPIDIFASRISQNNSEFSICFHRFSIGCILFSRNIWKLMNYIQDAPEGQLGIDEIALCNWCMEKQYAIIIAERAYAGHFSFAPQNNFMQEYYGSNKWKFIIKEG